MARLPKPNKEKLYTLSCSLTREQIERLFAIAEAEERSVSCVARQCFRHYFQILDEQAEKK